MTYYLLVTLLCILISIERFRGLQSIRISVAVKYVCADSYLRTRGVLRLNFPSSRAYL